MPKRRERRVCGDTGRTTPGGTRIIRRSLGCGDEASKRLLTVHSKALALPQPQFEVKFHPTRKWRLDAVWGGFTDGGAAPVALEIQGGIHTQGRHTRGSGYERDIEKHNEVVLAGYKLLYATPQHVKRGDAIFLVERALKGKTPEE